MVNVGKTIREQEDWQSLFYIKRLVSQSSRELTLLEVGSGTCRFVRKVAKLFPSIKITCIEINPQLAEMARQDGFSVICGTVLDIKDGREYDIVHCSHVIEHFGYPAIADLLDFLMAATSCGGILIIISPLAHAGFYDDLDHVRPYPPKAIVNYFTQKQQQRKGHGKFTLLKVWYRTAPWGMWNSHEPIGLLRKALVWLLYGLWHIGGFPHSKPNGYVMVMRVGGARGFIKD